MGLGGLEAVVQPVLVGQEVVVEGREYSSIQIAVSRFFYLVQLMVHWGPLNRTTFLISMLRWELEKENSIVCKISSTVNTIT